MTSSGLVKTEDFDNFKSVVYFILFILNKLLNGELALENACADSESILIPGFKGVWNWLPNYGVRRRNLAFKFYFF